MRFRRLTVAFRHAAHRSRTLQIVLLNLFWLSGEALVRLTGLPIPGGIIGLLFALGLLASGRVSLFSLRRGANWFLEEMLLFFVPAVLAVTDHRELLGLLGVKILAVIVASTLTVMSATALAVDGCYRWKVKRVAVLD